MAEEKLPYAVPSFHNWSLLAKFYHPLQAGSIDGTDTFPHDKAIWRAVQAKYKPNKKVTGNPRCTIFVGRLSKDTEEASLIKKFSKCGHIKKCRLIRDIVTGFSKGYAFIEYESERDAKIAYREMYKTDIDGREILIEYELERTLPGWIPRRLGGGFGGQKESGQLRFGGRDRPFRRPLPVKTMGQASKFNENTESTDSNRHATTDSNWNRDVERNRNRERDRERDREGDRKRDRDRHRDRDRVRKRNRDRERERDQSRYRDRDVREGRIRDGSGSRHIEGENTGPIDERRLYRDEVKDGSRERSKWKDERADRERHQKK